MFLGIINLAVLCVILVAGLWPFNFLPENKVRWLKDQNGVQFFGRGILYTRAPIPISPRSFSLEICVQPGKESFGGTARILSLYDGHRTERVVLSQWKSALLLQKSIQDRPEESYPKVGLRDALLKGIKRVVTVTSGPEGTRIYLNGKPAGRYPNFVLFSQNDSRPAKLVLGNSPGGKQAWNGNIYGLAIYGHALTEEQVFRHSEQWRNGEGTSFLREKGVTAFYLFDKHSGDLARDDAGEYHLYIPPRFEVLQKTILSSPWRDFRLTRSYFTDILTNILGFIPWGFFLSAFVRARTSCSLRRLILFSILVAGLTSLSIELIQAYLPTRSSQLTDVICNTLGMGIGAASFSWTARRHSARWPLI